MDFEIIINKFAGVRSVITTHTHSQNGDATKSKIIQSGGTHLESLDVDGQGRKFGS
jgi:hypothetical protein